ncbi:hypothetical protein [Nocardia sp. NPDC048505]|uniref:hypothetical protein n=1 Tax=unclassified Nocardia TaxID=2637762 RepID=UPI0033D46F1B
MTVMLRVSEATRDRVLALAAEEFGGATVEEVLIHLLDEHWEAMAVNSMERYRAAHPDEWREYLADAEHTDQASAGAADGWSER